MLQFLEQNIAKSNAAVRHGDYAGSKFLESVVQELVNVTSHMNALTFFVKMTLGKLIDFLEESRGMTLPSHVNCGLYDPWNGAGSVLEIELEKPVVIPKKYVEIHVDGTRGYGGKGSLRFT